MSGVPEDPRPPGHETAAAESKRWFFDQILAKYGNPEWTFAPGYPLLDRIVLYEQQIEILTGKQSTGLNH
jgi:hypothetical protein